MSLLTKASQLLYPEVAKDKAVTTTLSLIGYAFCSGLIIASIVPKLISMLPKEISEQTGIFLGLIIGLISTLGLTLYSWDRVSNTVGVAIEAAAKEDIENFVRSNSLDVIREGRDLEFKSVVLYIKDRISSPQPADLLSDKDHTMIARQSLARFDILKSLWNQDRLLKSMALRACMEAYGTQANCHQDIEHDSVLRAFRKDIYIYLKAWLLYSIREGSAMSIEILKPESFDNNTIKKWEYISAIEYIRDELVDDKKITVLLNEEYLEESKVLLKEYLTKLIKMLDQQL